MGIDRRLVAVLICLAGPVAAQDGGDEDGEPTITLPLVGEITLPGFLSFLADDPDGDGSAAGAGGSSGPPAVIVAEAQTQAVGESETFTGRVAAIERVDIIPRVAGYIDEVAFEGGAFVSEGDTLFRIDPSTYEAALRSAEAELAGAEAQRAEAERELERDRELQGSGTIPEAELQTSAAAAESAAATVTQAEAAVREAELRLEFTTITAAIGGQISAPMATRGNYVSAQGEPLAELVQVDPVWGVFPVGEAQLASWRRMGLDAGAAAPMAGGSSSGSSGSGGEARGGMQAGGSGSASAGASGSGAARGPLRGGPRRLTPAEYRWHLILPDGSPYAAEGDFAFVGNTINPNTGSVELRVRFANPDGLLVPGQNVTLEVSEADPPQRPVVPQSAIQLSREGRSVWIVNGDDTVERRSIEVGEAAGPGDASVVAGLEGGERIVVQGAMNLSPGATVAPREAGEDPSGTGGVGQ